METGDKLLAIFEATNWWKYVQDEVKSSIIEILKTVESDGILFKKAFSYSCHFYSNRETSPNTKSILFGNLLTEHQYKCALYPAKCLLNLEDWFRPNEADVYACLFLCTQIALLETIGVISEETV